MKKTYTIFQMAIPLSVITEVGSDKVGGILLVRVQGGYETIEKAEQDVSESFATKYKGIYTILPEYHSEK